jgi:hypothetical protein
MRALDLRELRIFLAFAIGLLIGASADARSAGSQHSQAFARSGSSVCSAERSAIWRPHRLSRSVRPASVCSRLAPM